MPNDEANVRLPGLGARRLPVLFLPVGIRRARVLCLALRRDAGRSAKRRCEAAGTDPRHVANG